MLTVSQGPTHHFFGLENILVTYYVQVPPLAALREREAWMRDITRTHDRVALMVVVDKDAVGPLPGDDFRAVLRDQAEQYKHLTACSAVVLEGNGLLVGVFILLIPLSLTMSLLWKAKEVVMQGVFNAR